MPDTIKIVIPVYEGVTQLDFTGPHQFFSRTPGAEVTVASVGGAPVRADGLEFSALADLANVEACDFLCVPGGGGCARALENPDYMKEIVRLAARARYIGSVCTGSLILGAAGLLRGRRAACHWAWRDLLPLFGAIPDSGRVVRDGNIFTGGGVTAGIDFALAVIAELRGPATAQAIQLGLEYAPRPPFDSGRPETAAPEVLAAVEAANRAQAPARRAAVERAAARLQG